MSAQVLSPSTTLKSEYPILSRLMLVCERSAYEHNRAERVLDEWNGITDRAAKVYEGLDKQAKPAYFELVYMLCQMQTNLNELYVSCESSSSPVTDYRKADRRVAARSMLYAQQARTAANVYAQKTFAHFENDWNLTEQFHSMLDRKWDQ